MRLGMQCRRAGQENQMRTREASMTAPFGTMHLLSAGAPFVAVPMKCNSRSGRTRQGFELGEQFSVDWLGPCLHRVFQVTNVARPDQDGCHLWPAQHELNSDLAKGRSVAVLLEPREQALRPG